MVAVVMVVVSMSGIREGAVALMTSGGEEVTSSIRNGKISDTTINTIIISILEAIL
jgi:hypothetical protein